MRSHQFLEIAEMERMAPNHKLTWDDRGRFTCLADTMRMRCFVLKKFQRRWPFIDRSSEAQATDKGLSVENKTIAQEEER